MDVCLPSNQSFEGRAELSVRFEGGTGSFRGLSGVGGVSGGCWVNAYHLSRPVTYKIDLFVGGSELELRAA